MRGGEEVRKQGFEHKAYFLNAPTNTYKSTSKRKAYLLTFTFCLLFFTPGISKWPMGQAHGRHRVQDPREGDRLPWLPPPLAVEYVAAQADRGLHC